MENLKDKNATTKDAGRQWSNDEGIDLRFRLVEQLNELLQDEAAANAGYADVLESDNPYLDDGDKGVIKAIMSQEKAHQMRLQTMIDKLDKIVAVDTLELPKPLKNGKNGQKKDDDDEPFLSGLEKD